MKWEGNDDGGRTARAKPNGDAESSHFARHAILTSLDLVVGVRVCDIARVTASDTPIAFNLLSIRRVPAAEYALRFVRTNEPKHCPLDSPNRSLEGCSRRFSFVEPSAIHAHKHLFNNVFPELPSQPVERFFNIQLATPIANKEPEAWTCFEKARGAGN